MSHPVENHRGVAIYETPARTLVVPPSGFQFCIDGPETDEGPTLRTFASIDEAKEAIDDDAESLAFTGTHN